MQLNPRQLDAFRKVMVTGSMTVAAELLGVSQPAVSRLIKDLETSLAIRLFRREGNRLIPGPEAQRLFREVDRFYQGMEQVERVANDLKSLRVGSLRVGCISVLGLSLLCEAVRLFSLERPGVAVALDVRNSISVLEMTAANQVDVGFVNNMGTEYPGVNAVPLRRVPAMCAVPRGHRLASKTDIELNDLKDEPLIALGSNNPMRIRLEIALANANVTCRSSVETTLAYSACNMVAGGLGVSVVDAVTASQFPNPEVVFRPLTPEIFFEFAMVLPSHQQRSIVLNDFIKVATQLFDTGFI